MTRYVIIATVAAAFFFSCHFKRIEYIKFNAGLCYRIVNQGDGQTIQHGEIVKLHMKQVYRDSLLSNNTDSIPFYQVQDSAVISAAAYILFSKVRKGDSIIFKALTDSVFKNKFPAFAKRGEWMYTHVYIKDVLPAGYNYDVDLKNEMRARHMDIPQ